MWKQKIQNKLFNYAENLLNDKNKRRRIKSIEKCKEKISQKYDYVTKTSFLDNTIRRNLFYFTR